MNATTTRDPRQTIRRSLTANVEAVHRWNAQHPAGTKVRVIMDAGLVLDTVTESEAWLLGGHTAVILLLGIHGAYALARVRPQ